MKIPSGAKVVLASNCAKVLLWYTEYIGAISILQDDLTCKS